MLHDHMERGKIMNKLIDTVKAEMRKISANGEWVNFSEIWEVIPWEIADQVTEDEMAELDEYADSLNEQIFGYEFVDGMFDRLEREGIYEC